MKEYQFSIPDYDFFIRIQVYPSIKSMTMYSNEYVELNNGKISDEEALGLWFGLPRNKQKFVVNKKRMILERELGKIFLCSEYLTIDTLAHECLHATLEFMSTVLGFTSNPYGTDMEEFFVGIFTNIFHEAFITLLKARYKFKVELI
jgi:hypothetical protein